jgi:aspartate/methionine/tyrosine aminotransferase
MTSSMADKVPKPLKDITQAFTESVKATGIPDAVFSHEHESEAHQMWRRHANHSGHSSEPHPVPGVQSSQATGVIYITNRAQAAGFGPGVEGWANCGQGAPETGLIPGAAPKPSSLDFGKFGDDIHEYAPTAGFKPLRDAIADYYNREFRQDKTLKYGAENVCVVPGGRSGLSRIAAVLGDINLGFSVPVYSAYEQMLSAFSRFVPIPTQTEAKNGYKLTPDEIRKEILGRGLSAFLMSNPNNPTGKQIHGEELAELVKVGRDTECSMILDEFYSW